MVKILVKGTLFCPVFTCDICGDMIGDVAEGAAVYVDREPKIENMKIDVIHVHKIKCQEVAVKNSKQKTDWQHLGAHIYFLCANSEVDSKQLEHLSRIHGARTA